jgi:hypothetical protein
LKLKTLSPRAAGFSTRPGSRLVGFASVKIEVEKESGNYLSQKKPLRLRTATAVGEQCIWFGADYGSIPAIAKAIIAGVPEVL